MFHMPSQSSAPPQLSSAPPPRTTQPWQPSKLDSNTVPTQTLNGSTSVSHADATPSKSAVGQSDDVQVAHQGIVGSIPFFSSQSSAPPARPRPKVTVEDVPEDSPVLSKAVSTTVPAVMPSVPVSRPVQPPQHTTVANANSTLKSAVGDQPHHKSGGSPVLSKAIPTSVPTITPSVPVMRPVQSLQHTTVANANSTSKSTVADQHGHKSSPQSRNKDPLLHRGTEPSPVPAAPPMPPPTSAAAPTPTRMSYPAPPSQPTFAPSVQATPAQRATSHTTPSRTYQRAAEMLQASKLSTSVDTNPGATGNINKSAAAPTQTTYNPVSTATGQHQPVNGASVHGPSASRLVNTSITTTPHPSASATVSGTKVAAHTTMIGSGPYVGALGLHISAASTSINTQLPSAPDPLKQQPTRPGALSIPSLDTTSTTVMSTAAVKNAHQEQPTVDSTRLRDVTPSATRNFPPSSHIYPTSARPSTSSAMTQQTHVTPAQPSTHHRVVSLPITPSSLAVQKPPSPRKYSQPISSATVSTQPFPSRPSAPEPQSARVPVSGHVFTPAPVRSARPPPLDRTNDFDMLKTPSSIAPSPMLNPDTLNGVPQSITVPIRARQSSTDSKDDKKKPSGLFGLFRTRTLSSKAADPQVISTVTRASVDQGKVHPDASVTVPTTVPVPRGVILNSASKESNSAQPPAPSTSTRAGLQSNTKGRVPDPIAIPPPPTKTTREHKDTTPHIFTPFKFLTMHSKRNRTVSAASLDVCDGNTAVSILLPPADMPLIMPVDRPIL